MEKEFVPYNLALELKELGFNESCLATYHKELHTIIPIYAKYTTEDVIKAPLYQQVFRWLYQKLDIEKGVMPLDAESQQLLLKELIDKVSY